MKREKSRKHAHSPHSTLPWPLVPPYPRRRSLLQRLLLFLVRPPDFPPLLKLQPQTLLSMTLADLAMLRSHMILSASRLPSRSPRFKSPSRTRLLLNPLSPPLAANIHLSMPQISSVFLTITMVHTASRRMRRSPRGPQPALAPQEQKCSLIFPQLSLQTAMATLKPRTVVTTLPIRPCPVLRRPSHQQRTSPEPKVLTAGMVMDTHTTRTLTTLLRT